MLLFGRKEKEKYDKVFFAMINYIAKLEKENLHLKSQVVELSVERTKNAEMGTERVWQNCKRKCRFNLGKKQSA